jgi:uncharacterized membrane protein (UPF0136 family)
MVFAGMEEATTLLLMTLFCSLFLIVGIYSAIQTINCSINWVEAEGVVVESTILVEGAGESRSLVNAHKIQFVERRTSILITASHVGSGQHYDVGQKLMILYDPGILDLAPGPDGTFQRAIAIKDRFFYLVPIGLTGVGGLGTFVFLRSYLRSRSKKP